MHRSYNKIHVIADSSPNAQAAKRSIIKKYKNYPINDSDVFIVLGGDGFMLASLKKYQKYHNLNMLLYVIKSDSFLEMMCK